MWAAFLCSVSLFSGCLVLSEASPCDDGFELYQGQTEDTCIKVRHDRRVTWHLAHYECREENSHLVEIMDVGLNEFIQGRLSKRRRYWLGGVKFPNNEYYFYYYSYMMQDHWPFQNWAKNHSMKKKDYRECIEMNGKNGLWTGTQCCVSRYFVCQHPTDGEKNTYDYGWK